MSTYAVILAGGVGARLGADRPKQFVTVAGRMILDYSLDAFSSSDLIDEIVVVVAPDHRRRVAELVKTGGRAKVSALVDAGAERFDSTAAAVAHLSDRDGLVLVHDAARPFLPDSTITGLVKALAGVEAVATVTDSPDTIVQLASDGSRIESTLDRGRLRRLQTPQAFRLDTLSRAIALASRDREFVATDDFTIVQRYLPGAATGFIEGSPRTFKITTPEDLLIAEAFAAHPFD